MPADAVDSRALAAALATAISPADLAETPARVLEGHGWPRTPGRTAGHLHEHQSEHQDEHQGEHELLQDTAHVAGARVLDVWNAEARAAERAAAAGDYAAQRVHLLRLAPIAPRHGRVLAGLARTEARLGGATESLAHLNALAAAGLTRDVRADSDLAALRGRPRSRASPGASPRTPPPSRAPTPPPFCLTRTCSPRTSRTRSISSSARSSFVR